MPPTVDSDAVQGGALQIGGGPLRPKGHFDKRTAEEMKKHLTVPVRSLQETMA
ncbi:hypothetical protein V2A60_009518, partial [Cordyceps javanica]